MPSSTGRSTSSVVAEGFEVVDPGLDRPVLGRAPVAPAGPAEVEIDDLCDVGERRPDVLLVEGVVGAGAGVEQDDRRPVAHPRPVRRELDPVDVEEQIDSPDRDLHSSSVSGLEVVEEQPQLVVGLGRVAEDRVASAREAPEARRPGQQVGGLPRRLERRPRVILSGEYERRRLDGAELAAQVDHLGLAGHPAHQHLRVPVCARRSRRS